MPDEDFFFRQAAHYGGFKRLLYKEVARYGGRCKDHKTSFCAEHKITSRQFNAIAIDLQGNIDSVQELLKQSLEEKNRLLKKYKGKLKRAKALRKEVDEGKRKKPLTPRQDKSNRKALCRLPDQIKSVKAAIDKIKKRLKAFVPGICFGTKKLFNAQFHLEQSGFASHEDWLKSWRVSRDHQFFLVGSKDETAGNQSCVLTLLDEGGLDQKAKFSLRIRAFDQLLPQKEGSPLNKYVNIDFQMSHGREQLLAALARHQALSYRFHYEVEKQAWYVHISFDIDDVPLITIEKQYGVIGVDFNEDHLAVTDTDFNGNLLETFKVPLDLEGLSTNQREDVLSLAVHKVVDFALAKKKPIAIEELDFSKKRSNMDRMSKKRKVKLSGLMYAKYQKFMGSLCAKKGIELIRVNPAYTSVIGKIKYAQARGWSVHAAAAGVIARRAQGFQEMPPASVKLTLGPVVKTLSLPVRNDKSETINEKWAKYRKRLRETLRQVISLQKKTDRLRFKKRQHCRS